MASFLGKRLAGPFSGGFPSRFKQASHVVAAVALEHDERGQLSGRLLFWRGVPRTVQ